MDNPLEKPNITFQKHTGRETTVKILKETLINDKGYFGDIFDTMVEIDGHKKRVIIKKYIGDEEEKKRYAKQALENYFSAKKSRVESIPDLQDKR